MKKSLLFGALAVAVSFGCAAREYTQDDIQYTLKYDNTLEVTGVERHSEDNVLSGIIEIPEEVTIGFDTYKVTSIKREAFKDCYYLTNVFLPNTIEKIGRDAFMNCYSLRGMALPASLKELEYNIYLNNTIFYRTPIETLSLFSETIPEFVDLKDMFTSEYLKRIIIPKGADAVYEKAYPEIKEGRIKVTIDLSEYPGDGYGFTNYRVGSPFLTIDMAYYPYWVMNTSANIPREAVMYLSENEDVFIYLPMFYAGADNSDGDDEPKGLLVDGNSVSSSRYNSVTANRFDYRFCCLKGLKDGSVIKYKFAGSEVDEVLETMPDRFDVYNAAGILVAKNADAAALNNLERAFYVLKAENIVRKVMAGK